MILHVITSLNNGGAESVLYRLVASDKAHSHHVVSLMGMGKYGPLLEEAGVQVTCLNMPAGRFSLSGIWRLYCLLRSESPFLVQCWMYHADLIGGCVARLAGIKKVFWNIRHSELEFGRSKLSTILVAKLCAGLSGSVPERIICCGHKALDVHVEYGYKRSKMVVIANGYNVDLFKPSIQTGIRLRNELKLEDDSVLFGMVGRFNIQKNHLGLLKSLSLINTQSINFYCVLVGADMNSQNSQLTHWIESFGLSHRVLLLDQRNDIPDVMNALDVHVLSSSFGEGFPNVLAEAMACGIPCVTTDVGDAALIVGDTGWTVPPRDEVALAAALASSVEELKLLPNAWKQRKVAASLRINENFSLGEMINSYRLVWGFLDKYNESKI